jgi:flagellar biosynthesis/type III secretory pathway protein FliH
MLLTEWNWDDAKEVWQEEARMKGREEGLEKGLEEGLEKGLEKGQNKVLELMKQGYSVEEIEAKLFAGKSPSSLADS